MALEKITRSIYICGDHERSIPYPALIRGSCSLGILEAVGDIRYSAKDGEKPVLIEEDGAFSTNTKQARRDEAEQAIKAIRRESAKYSFPLFCESRVWGCDACIDELPCSTMMRACEAWRTHCPTGSRSKTAHQARCDP